MNFLIVKNASPDNFLPYFFTFSRTTFRSDKTFMTSQFQRIFSDLFKRFSGRFRQRFPDEDGPDEGEERETPVKEPGPVSRTHGRMKL